MLSLTRAAEQDDEGGVSSSGPARSTFKPRDVEELVDYWVNRPIANLLVALLAPLPITPNQVTVLSGVVGLVAGVVIGTAPLGPSYQVPLGGLILYLSILLDCADGQLARLRKQSSMVGRFLDGLVDVVPVAAVFTGFCVYMTRAGYPFWLVYGVGAVAGYSMKWHVHAYDHAKNVYLGNVLPLHKGGASALPTLEEIARERDLHRQRGDVIGAWLLQGFYNFTRSQRAGWQGQRLGLGSTGTRTDADRALYRDRFQGTMRLWTFNGLASHHTLLLAATAATPFFAGSALVAYLAFLVPMNLFTLYLLFHERQVERAVRGGLQADISGRLGASR